MFENETMESVYGTFIEIFHQHKRFSAVQKLVILALVIGGVSLLTGLWMWMVTYTLTLISTILVCHYLITTNANFTLLENILVLLKAHENDSWYISLTELVRNSLGIGTHNGNELLKENEAKREGDFSSWEDEIHLLATLISQDFIRPWYLTVSDKQNLLEEKEEVLDKAFRRLCVRFSEIDIHELFQELLLCYREHLRCFQLAKSAYYTQPRRRSVSSLDPASSTKIVSSIEEAYEFKFTYHSAVWESENEIIYLKSLISILLTEYLDTHLQDSKTPHVLLVEILTYNVAKPVFDLLSNSEFLHECIVHILSDETLITIPPDAESSEKDFAQFKDVQEDDNEFKDAMEVFSSREEMSHQSSHHIEHKGHQESLSGNTQTSTDNKIGAQVAKEEELAASLQTHIPNDKTEESSLAVASDSRAREHIEESQRFYLGSFDDIKETCQQTPKLFKSICITNTETATENRGANQYTLYTIQYDAVYEDQGSPRVRTNVVKRRFREFINLQNRLEDNPEYKKSLKDVKGLTKWLSLPFGNMDKNSIEKRKNTLENFMKSLLEKDDVCSSPEIKEFLAYDGNAHIAFVRKVPDSIQPFTKMIRSVSSVFDKIGEFSTNMTELLPSLPRRVQTKDIQSSMVDEDQILLEFGTIKGDVLVLERLFTNYVQVAGCSKVSEDNEASGNISQNADEATDELHDTALTEIAIDIAVQALQGRNCWLCRERVISLAKHMFGTAVNRWLRWKISDLTTPHRCAMYLHLFREAIWPNGKFDSSSREVKSEKQRSVTKQQATRVLAEFFPDVLVQLLDKEDYQSGIEEIIDSIQYKKLNKHFIYTFLDIIMEKLFSKSHQEALQKEVL